MRSAGLEEFGIWGNVGDGKIIRVWKTRTVQSDWMRSRTIFVGIRFEQCVAETCTESCLGIESRQTFV